MLLQSFTKLLRSSYRLFFGNFEELVAVLVRHLQSNVKLVLLRLNLGVFMSDAKTVLFHNAYALLKVFDSLQKRLVHLA